MDIGLVLSADYLPVHQLLELAPQLDMLGYSQVSVPEIWSHDAISLLAALALKTKRIKLATGILNMFSRSPGLVAMTAASLDELSNGRFILGIGLSGPKVIENFHGRPFKKPLKHTREFVSVIRSLLAGERLNIDSELLGTLKDFRMNMKITRADLPIHIAALGPKNISTTVKIADGWIPVIMPFESFKSELANVHKQLSPAKKDSFMITPFTLALLGDSEEVKNLLKGHMAYYFGGMGTFYNNMLQRLGFEDEASAIRTKWEKGDVLGATRAVSDELLDMTCVYGSVDYAREKLKKMTSLGNVRPLLSVPFRTPLALAQDTLTKLAPTNLR